MQFFVIFSVFCVTMIIKIKICNGIINYYPNNADNPLEDNLCRYHEGDKVLDWEDLVAPNIMLALCIKIDYEKYEQMYLPPEYDLDTSGMYPVNFSHTQCNHDVTVNTLLCNKPQRAPDRRTRLAVSSDVPECAYEVTINEVYEYNLGAYIFKASLVGEYCETPSLFLILGYGIKISGRNDHMEQGLCDFYSDENNALTWDDRAYEPQLQRLCSRLVSKKFGRGPQNAFDFRGFTVPEYQYEVNYNVYCEDPEPVNVLTCIHPDTPYWTRIVYSNESPKCMLEMDIVNNYAVVHRRYCAFDNLWY